MAEHDGEGDLTLEELRDIRDFMLTARDRMYTPRQGGERGEFYECCWCRATGGWPSEIAHRPVTSEGGAVPCRVARGTARIGRVIRRVQALEGRSGDSPVIGGEVRG